ncbi:hypothetical protein HID58_014434 [Brassica napus]|uniref:Uncharacterized protein n=1 Tax=Brassica napus TaxID=3708 RepID=A0ABQ8DH55_BRANA|nr:hypothetical protein HID58_014434 [Brassica napus]
MDFEISDMESLAFEGILLVYPKRKVDGLLRKRRRELSTCFGWICWSLECKYSTFGTKKPWCLCMSASSSPPAPEHIHLDKESEASSSSASASSSSESASTYSLSLSSLSLFLKRQGSGVTIATSSSPLLVVPCETRKTKSILSSLKQLFCNPRSSSFLDVFKTSTIQMPHIKNNDKKFSSYLSKTVRVEFSDEQIIK